MGLLSLLSACGVGLFLPFEPSPVRHLDVDVVHTALRVDVSSREGHARVTLAPGPRGGTLEVGDLDLISVEQGGEPLAHRREGPRIDLALPRRTHETTIDIRYRYRVHEALQGAHEQLTMTFPYHCGQIFPCHSAPADGQRFDLQVVGIPEGQVLVAPEQIAVDVPPGALGWTYGDYESHDLGTTRSGMAVRAWAPPQARPDVARGTRHLVAAIDHLEQTYGATPSFGGEIGPVWVRWPEEVPYGGVEHVPYWHVRDERFSDPEVHVHEATHLWFGNGVRMACWEDFAFVESVTTYVAVRALEAVADPWVAEASWDRMQGALDFVSSDPRAGKGWPEGCNTHDPLDDIHLSAAYVNGALFLRALEARVGRERLDASLRAFYLAHRGQAARFDDLLRAVARDTGYDPRPCAEAWFRQVPPPASTICAAE